MSWRCGAGISIGLMPIPLTTRPPNAPGERCQATLPVSVNTGWSISSSWISTFCPTGSSTTVGMNTPS